MPSKVEKRNRRHVRIKSRMNSDKPRLVVFRSLDHIYAQIIDDSTGKTIVSASDMKSKKGMKKTERATEVGKELAKKALENKIDVCVFDRAGYRFHGRVKALCEGAREGGLKV